MAAPQTPTVGPDVVVPGSQQVAPVFFLAVALATAMAGGVSLVLRRRRARAGLPRRPPVVLAVAAGVALLGPGLAFARRPPPLFVPRFGSLPRLLPDDAFFYRRVEDLPVSPDSARWIRSQRSQRLGPGFTGRVTSGVVFGIPFNLVDRRTPTRDVSIRQAADTSYPGPYPISDPAYIESMPTYGFDQHYVAVDEERHLMWELISTRAWFGRWEADSGALWHLDSVAYGRGSTISSGLPLLPGTITYDQVAAGRVDHVILAGGAVSAAGRWVWPARGTDGRSTDADAMPQGAWLRLRADADLSGLGPQARVIAAAPPQYGMVLSDTGPGLGLRGTPDGRWDDADLGTLGTLTADDFDVVDPSSIMVAPDSMGVRPAG